MNQLRLKLALGVQVDNKQQVLNELQDDELIEASKVSNLETMTKFERQ